MSRLFSLFRRKEQVCPVNSWLDKLVLHLAESEQELRPRGESAARKIFNVLKKNRSDVDRYVISGSLGENGENIGIPNAPVNSDSLPHFDLVIFLQDQTPPFWQVLRDFADVFMNDEEFTLSNVHHSEYIGIVTEGLKFHVFPATNFSSNSETPVEIQRQNLFNTIIITKNVDEFAAAGRLYSASFAEMARSFMDQQSDLTKSLILLGKFWIRHIKLDEAYHVHGLSYLVEVLAIRAAANKKDNELVEALADFFRFFVNFRTARITLFDKPVPVCFWKLRLPLVLDPVNPYNNLAALHDQASWQNEIVAELCNTATASIWKLESARMKSNIRVTSLQDITKIFIYTVPTKLVPLTSPAPIIVIIKFLLTLLILLVLKPLLYFIRLARRRTRPFLGALVVLALAVLFGYYFELM